MTVRGLVPWLTSLLVHVGLLLVPLGLLLVPTREQAAPSVELTFAPSRSAAPRTGAGSAGRLLATVDPSAAPQVSNAPAFRTVPRLTGKSSTEGPSEQGGAATASDTSVGTTGASGNDVAGLEGTGTSIVLAGAPRKVMHASRLHFPTSLSASGLEVDGEARITVSPSGAVTRVEITQGTSYIEIDTYVAEALRDYLFSRVDSGVDAVGTVRFRFRLEKTD